MGPLVLCLLAAVPSQSALERAVRDRFESVGRTAPPVDPSLSQAAAELAKWALHHGVEEATELLRVTAALSKQNAWDPNPIIVALRASNHVLASEFSKQDFGIEPTTHQGIGVAIGPERSAIIVILAKRRIDLSHFPRRFLKPSSGQRLCGTLDDSLRSAEVFITRPDGTVDLIPMEETERRVCASSDFQHSGRHTVEILASGPRGPEVAALFFVDVGDASGKTEPVAFDDEPVGKSGLATALLQRINALRLRMGVPPVQADVRLDGVAQAWADRLAAEGFFSHIAPDGNTLKQRLAGAGYAFGAAGENLGLSSGVLSAHFGIEHSPGHRRNLIEPNHRRLGIGMATRKDGLQVLVEVLATPVAPEERDPLGSLYASIHEERKRRKLPALRFQPALESLAMEHAKRALAADVPKAQLPNETTPHARAFALVDDLTSLSIDVFVSDTPQVVASKNVATRENTVVGVGLVRGSSARYGQDRYWVVVMYGITKEQ